MSTRGRPMLAVGATAALAVAVVAILAAGSVDRAAPKVPPRTARVQRGTVRATVTATGRIVPAGTLSVNFSTGRVVSEVDVKPGDPVRAGQILARIDDTQTKAALASAQAALDSARANLGNTRQPALPAVVTQSPAVVASARQQVVAAQSGLNAAVQGAAINGIGYQGTVNQLQAGLNRDTEVLYQEQATCSSGGGPACPSLLAEAQAAIATDTDALANARQRQVANQFKDEQSIQQARNSLVAARDILASLLAAGDGRAPAAGGGGGAAAQSQVIQAQANLVMAQGNEAATALTAPSAGTVAAVNGVPGQTVSGGGTSTSAGSPAFVTVADVSVLQVVAGLGVADAGRIRPGLPVTIWLDALPDRTVSGLVSSIEVNPKVVGQAFNATVTLRDPPTTLKPGMAAHFSVVARVRDNVLHVPTADVTTRDGTSTVVLLRDGRQILLVVTTGLVGDQFTEIKSGLNEGETIIEPALPAASGAR